MQVLLLTLLLLAGASANEKAAPRDDVTAASDADQSPDASHAVTYVQSHVTTHGDGYGHGPDEYHRHTVATTYHYPDHPYHQQAHGYTGGVYVAGPSYGPAVVAPGYAGGYAPGYGGYGHDGYGGYGHDGYGYGHDSHGYGHGGFGYGHDGHSY